MSSQANRIGIIVCFVLGTALVLLMGKFIEPELALSVPDRMKRECERQFVNELPERINDCRIKLQMRWLAENHRDKMESAYQRSR